MEIAPSAPVSPFDDGELYDLILGELDFGLEFYLDLAKQAAGPVLDVACGTGRILLPALQAGLEVEGLDAYRGMLDRLRQKAEALGLNPTLHEADMNGFRLGRRFALIVIPFNAFVHNMSADAQLGCLNACREHLSPGGLLAFDTFFPAREIVDVPPGTRVLEGQMSHPATGLPLRMYDTRTFDRVAQTQSSLNEIEFLDEKGNVFETRASEHRVRWIYKNEMELLLRLAGFARWEICGDFDRRPLINETDAMIVLAWNHER